jgi:hypothetical protein
MSLIDQVIELSGPLPDPVRYRHHLEGLKPERLQERLTDLLASSGRRTGGNRWERPANLRRAIFAADSRPQLHDLNR